MYTKLEAPYNEGLCTVASLAHANRRHWCLISDIEIYHYKVNEIIFERYITTRSFNRELESYVYLTKLFRKLIKLTVQSFFK